MERYKKRNLTRATILNSSLAILLTVVVVSSCQTKKQPRDLRAKRGYDQFDPYARTPFKPTSRGEVMTRGLFMQNKRANVELPKQEGMSIDPTTGQVIVGEDVTYTNADNHSRYFTDNSDVKADTVYSLSEVTVEAKSRFAPEHEGKIAVDFVITVPKELLSPVWRVTLNPRIVDTDSIVELPPLILKGSQFREKQINDYAAYDAYLKSIVDTADYDSVFLDVDGIRFDIQERQKFYYDKYYKEWEKQIAYEKWKVDEENRNERYMAQQIGKRNELYHEYSRRANEEAMRAVAYGQDTTGMHTKYMKEYEKLTESLADQWEVNTAVRRIPKAFVDMHGEGRTLQDLYNDIMTDGDSMKIAKHRYFFDLIAENELKSARRDDRKKEIIQFPFETEMRDTISADGEDNVVYLYKQTYPTRVGMKSLSVLLDGRITAIDLSTYTIGTSDTIKYFIASMAQLVDMSLGSSETVLHKAVYSEMNTNITFAPNKTNFDPFFGDNKTEIEKIVDAYKTFTGPGKAAGYHADSIEMVVHTALDGSYDGNFSLAQKRAESIREYFERDYAYEISAVGLFKIDPTAGGEDWQSLVQEIRKSGSEIENGEDIINMLTTAMYPDQTKADIKSKYRADYNYITKNIFPKLQRVKFGFNLSRPGMTEETQVVSEEKPDYDKGLQLILDRNYEEALEIMANYPDYNTALLLACMGHNGQALDLVSRLTPNGHTEYLQAILKVRMGNEHDAVEHLKEACKLDPTKVYRTKLDPEILGLVRKYNIDLGQIVIDYEATLEPPAAPVSTSSSSSSSQDDGTAAAASSSSSTSDSSSSDNFDQSTDYGDYGDDYSTEGTSAATTSSESTVAEPIQAAEPVQEQSAPAQTSSSTDGADSDLINDDYY